MTILDVTYDGITAPSSPRWPLPASEAGHNPLFFHFS